MPQKRPQWNHPDVQTEAVAQVLPDVLDWAKAMQVLPADAGQQTQHEAQAIVTLAVQESADAYEAGRYLDNIIDWPVNGELIRILDRAYRAMPLLVPNAVHAWVMQEQVRVSGNVGDHIRFKVGDAELHGTIAGVIRREARLIVEVRKGPNKTDALSVNAEDIVKVSPARTKPSGSNPTPPTGGTPVAMPGGAQLKESRAA